MNTPPMPPFVFGQSAAVRAWEDEQEKLEKIESLKDEDFFVLTAKQAREITGYTDRLCDLDDSFTPEKDGITRKLYDLIFDESQEPLPGMEELGEAFSFMQMQLRELQSFALRYLEP
jgi:hypothetical protein